MTKRSRYGDDVMWHLPVNCLLETLYLSFLIQRPCKWSAFFFKSQQRFRKNSPWLLMLMIVGLSQNIKQRTFPAPSTWKWGLNLELCAYKASVLPLSHISSPTFPKAWNDPPSMKWYVYLALGHYAILCWQKKQAGFLKMGQAPCGYAAAPVWVMRTNILLSQFRLGRWFSNRVLQSLCIASP